MKLMTWKTSKLYHCLIRAQSDPLEMWFLFIFFVFSPSQCRWQALPREPPLTLSSMRSMSCQASARTRRNEKRMSETPSGSMTLPVTTGKSKSQRYEHTHIYFTYVPHHRSNEERVHTHALSQETLSHTPQLCSPHQIIESMHANKHALSHISISIQTPALQRVSFQSHCWPLSPPPGNYVLPACVCVYNHACMCTCHVELSGCDKTGCSPHCSSTLISVVVLVLIVQESVCVCVYTWVTIWICWTAFPSGL